MSRIQTAIVSRAITAAAKVATPIAVSVIESEYVAAKSIDAKMMYTASTNASNVSNAK